MSRRLRWSRGRACPRNDCRCDDAVVATRRLAAEVGPQEKYAQRCHDDRDDYRN